MTSTHTPSPLTEKQRTLMSEKRIYQWATWTVIIIAVSAAILSYDALRELAVMSEIPHILAFLFPVIIDGMILSGSLLTLHYANRGRRSIFGVLLTGLGVIASIAGNVAISPDNLTARLVHAAPPLILFLTVEAFTMLLRDKYRQKLLRVDVGRKPATNTTPKPAPPLTQEAKEPGGRNTVPQKREGINKPVNTDKKPPTMRQTIRQRIAENPHGSVEELVAGIDGDIKYARKIARQELNPSG